MGRVQTFSWFLPFPQKSEKKKRWKREKIKKKKKQNESEVCAVCDYPWFVKCVKCDGVMETNQDTPRRQDQKRSCNQSGPGPSGALQPEEVDLTWVNLGTTKNPWLTDPLAGQEEGRVQSICPNGGIGSTMWRWGRKVSGWDYDCTPFFLYRHIHLEV